MANVILPPGAPATVLPKLNTSLSGAIVADQSLNYVTDTGASNALVATVTGIDSKNLTVAAGLRLTLVTANTLQAGSNTLNVNSSGAKSILNNGGRNLKTSYAVGAILDLVYNGTAWVMLNSTY